MAASSLGIDQEEPADILTAPSAAPAGLPVGVLIEAFDGVVEPGSLPDLPTKDEALDLVFDNVSRLPCVVPFVITERPDEEPRFYIAYRNGCHYLIWQTLDWDPFYVAWTLANAGPEEWRDLALREAGYLAQRAQNLTSQP